MDLSQTALVLIGFQNDYFSKDGILHGVIDESSQVSGVLENTLHLLRDDGPAFGLVVSTPIVFTQNYEELDSPTGILKTIKEVGAFREGTHGCEEIDELKEFEGLITQVLGKRRLNAFSNTHLEQILRSHDIKTIVMAGTVTSICIDSTARHAADLGFEVVVLSDCTSGRTVFEQDFYCENIFPLYASVRQSQNLLSA